MSNNNRLHRTMTTMADRISRQLAEEIISGSMPPGQKLAEQALAKKFGVSRSPIRDALRQLGGTGLVEIKPNCSAKVVNLQVDQLTHIYEALGELEALCAKYCARRMTDAERKQLETLHRRSEAAVKERNTQAYADQNDLFHDLLHSGSHNQTLLTLSDELRRRLAPFRRPVFFHGTKRLPASWEEHDRVVSAIMASDPESAHREMAAHLVNSSLNVISYIEAARDS